jgi:hypothetical protein
LGKAGLRASQALGYLFRVAGALRGVKGFTYRERRADSEDLFRLIQA